MLHQIVLEFGGDDRRLAALGLVHAGGPCEPCFCLLCFVCVVGVCVCVVVLLFLFFFFLWVLVFFVLFLFFYLVDGGKDVLRLTFNDLGPGIADMVLALMFGWTSGSGLGKGLPGAKRLVNEFDIKTEVGVGTEVTITRWK